MFALIVKKQWRKGEVRPGYTYYTGWFLFGFIPLYIKVKGIEGEW